MLYTLFYFFKNKYSHGSLFIEEVAFPLPLGLFNRHPYSECNWGDINVIYKIETDQQSWATKCELLRFYQLSALLISTGYLKFSCWYLIFSGAYLKNAWWLYIGRLLVGCGIGLLSYVVIFVTCYLLWLQLKQYCHRKNTNKYSPLHNRYRFI